MVYGFEKDLKWVFQYLDIPPTLRAKNSIKELTDLINFFYLYFEADPYMLKQKIFRLKAMCFKIYKSSKIGNFQ